MAIKMEYDPNDSTWKPTVNIIRDTTDADEWTPHPDWPDIKYILQNDTYGYAGSFIELITDDYDTISLSGGVAYRTSDGAYYTSATVTHTWDKSKDVPCARGYKTRWVITYLSSDTLSTYFVKPVDTLWLIFNCNVANRPGTYKLYYLEAIEFLNNKKYTGTMAGNLFYFGCSRLLKIPDFGDANIITDTYGFFYALGQIKKIPALNLLTNNTGNTEVMYGYCTNLETIEGILDMQTITTTNSSFVLCYNLKNVSIKNLKVSLIINSCTILTHASLLYLLQNLQTVTAGSQTLTLGAINLAKLTDTEKALATDKGWLLA